MEAVTQQVAQTSEICSIKEIIVRRPGAAHRLVINIEEGIKIFPVIIVNASNTLASCSVNVALVISPILLTLHVDR